MKIQSYKESIVWQKAVELVVLIYRLTKSFPKEEQYGLTSQMRRASASIASNIAEGSRRMSKKEFRHFLLNAYGSGAELETQPEITKKLEFTEDSILKPIEPLLEEVMRMLNKMTFDLNESTKD